VIHGDPFEEDEEERAQSDHLYPDGAGKLSVLVVENESSYLERIKYLLQTAGFDVLVATNEQDAISMARVYRPQIVSLDLHIPINRTEYERDSQSGDREAGLRTLAGLREIMPDVRVVIPTTLFNCDEARETAARLNVSVANIVPKGQSFEGADWEGHFLLSVSRLREEITTQAILPALPPWLCPIIKVNPSSDFNTGRLHLVVNEKVFQTQKSNQGLLLALLIKRHDETVRYSEIDQEVAGRPVAENTRKMWIKNLREKIRTDWLGLSTKDVRRPELDILETVDDGLVLHAFIEGPEL
jgi:CheY-like chemotaxis protein